MTHPCPGAAPSVGCLQWQALEDSPDHPDPVLDDNERVSYDGKTHTDYKKGGHRSNFWLKV